MIPTVQPSIKALRPLPPLPQLPHHHYTLYDPKATGPVFSASTGHYGINYSNHYTGLNLFNNSKLVLVITSRSLVESSGNCKLRILDL
ncbi:hypothetical protein M0804_014749 [Polistes exclamans]|nr:hypothetical protein M0804_014750 [Polistes exclamans]KAI4474631.1 hypothetical protein M0804_014749 [Polistes exclamans]